MLSITKTEHRQLAENVALTALSGYLNTNPTLPLDTRLGQVKAKTQEIIQGNIKFAKPFMVSPSNTDNIDTRRGTTVDGVDGTLIPGNWYSNEPTSYAAFPAGTVLVKHLSLPIQGKQPIRLETQLLHYEVGSWNPYSYSWDDDGKEATLVSEIGSMRTLQVDMSNGRNEERTWR